ncbi:MAG: patatin-like phospholipase family protein [Flavobacteriales bacterium]|nr:patatin-like phospholipase family protein [Flavobacteriales bacterium]
MNEFRNLVFEGGGIKGIAYGGALEELNGLDVLPKIKRVAGTSVGAINALLLALGYEVSEVSDLVAKTNFREFEGNPHPKWWMLPGWGKSIKRLMNEYGGHSSDRFKEWLSEKIDRKTGNSEITFDQFSWLVMEDWVKKREERSGLKDLYVIGTDLSRKAIVIYSREHTPDVKIKDAICTSMSVPLLFEAQFNSEDDVLVDGGVPYNYAVNIFDNERYLEKEVNGEDLKYDGTPGFKFNHETLGFRLDCSKMIEDIKNNNDFPPTPVENYRSCATEILDYMMEGGNRSHLQGNDWHRTIFIDTLDVGATDFDIPQAKIEELMDSGRRGVKEHFEWRNGAHGVDKPV